MSGKDLIRGILTGYEVQVNLVKGICLHEHKIDHIAHLGPSVAAGLGSLLKLKHGYNLSICTASTSHNNFYKTIKKKEKFLVGKHLLLHMLAN